jgi:hypothetical protein
LKSPSENLRDRKLFVSPQGEKKQAPQRLLFLLAARSGSEVELQSELQLPRPLRSRDSAKVGVARQWPCVGSTASGIK